MPGTYPGIFINLILFIMSIFSSAWKSVKNAVGKIWSISGSAASLVPIPGMDVAGSVISDIGDELSGNTPKDLQQDAQNWNAYQAQLNRDFQREERIAAQDFNLEMWNKQNEYNSPAAQVERLRAAGINPNSVFGNGTLVGNNNSSVTTSPMSGAVAAPTSPISTDAMLKNATLANIMAQTAKTNSETDLNSQAYNWNQATEDIRYKQMVNLDKKTQEEIDTLIQDREIQKDIAVLMKSKTSEEINLIRQQLVNLRNENAHILAQIAETHARTANIEKNTQLQDAQIDKTVSETLNTDANTLQTGIQTQIADLELKHSQTLGMPVGTPAQEALFRLWLDGRDLEYFGLLGAGSDISANNTWIHNVNHIIGREIRDYIPYVRTHSSDSLYRR